MRVTLVAVVPRQTRTKEVGLGDLVAEYVKRTTRFTPCEEVQVTSAESLFALFDRQWGKTKTYLILLDGRGQSWTSEQFAEHLRQLRETAVQQLVLAVGPPDGWTEVEIARAQMTLSLGRMTLPHQLARVVLAEQVYRAFTILAGHPYHLGH